MIGTGDDRFDGYVEALRKALGHADRAERFCFAGTRPGCLLPLERKSVQSVAARVDPGRVSAAHRSLHHFVAKADWSDASLLTAVREQVVPMIETSGPLEA